MSSCGDEKCCLPVLYNLYRCKFSHMQILWSLCQMCTTKQCFIFPISTGDLLHHKDGQSPLHSLEQAAVHYASAIRLNSRDARLHFQLGLVLEEHHYATEMYSLQRKVWYYYTQIKALYAAY